MHSARCRFFVFWEEAIFRNKQKPLADFLQAAVMPAVGFEPTRVLAQRILSYSSHSEPNGLNRNKTVFSVTFQNIKNPKKPYKISIFDAKPQKHKQSTPSSIISGQTPNLRRWRDVGGMYAGYTSCKLVQKPYTLIEIVAASSVVDNT